MTQFFCLIRYFCRIQFLSKTKKIQKWKICLRKNKLGLIADFSLYCTGGWGGGIKHNDNDWKFQSYKGTNLGYDMICESIKSDQE